MRRLATLLAAALAATLAAAPVAAQTITAPGLVGPTACLGTSEVDTFDLADVTNITASSARLTLKNVNNLYSQLRASSGDGGPTSFPIRYTYTNAKTGQKSATTVITEVTSGSPNFGGTNQNLGFTMRTPHYFTIFTTAAGWGESRPLTRRCFMTGGTYTPSNEDGQPGYVANTTSGCFSISPRTYQDVRNCLCGRSRIWNNDDQNTAERRNLGCADAN
ncbi:MAG: hypothetical protein OXE81_00405 [Gammaproteobacteria bacterium]|nr:hypothetical protein [Gammaproteobacteria bacterium]